MARRRRGAEAARLVLVALAIAWSALPIVLVVLASFKEARDIFEVPPRLLFAAARTPASLRHAQFLALNPIVLSTIAPSKRRKPERALLVSMHHSAPSPHTDP